MKQYTGIKVFGVLLAAGAVIYFAYRFSEQSLTTLQRTVAEAAQPDIFLARLEALNTAVTDAESGVRAFAISHDDEYLKSFHDGKRSFSERFDSLASLAPDETIREQVHIYRSLAARKLTVYEELMLISYSEIFDSALVEIAEHIPDSDSTAAHPIPVAEKKRSFLQKIFSSGPSKQELQVRIDSALEAGRVSGERIRDVTQTIREAHERQARLMKERMDKELVVLARDKAITDEMNRVLARIKDLHDDAFQQRAGAANRNAVLTVQNLKYLIIGGAAVIVLLVGLILYDIVKAGRHRRELAAARQQAEQFARLKEEFLANMSHEIRTPLTSILGYTGRLARTGLSDKQIYYTKNIEVSSEHLLAIVNDVLDISRIDSGKLVFEKTRFQPAEVTEEIISVLQIKAAEKNIDLGANTYRIRGIPVLGDPMRLRQVLFNLVGNAIKFTDSGSVKVDVKALSEDMGMDAGRPVALFEFRVTDTGPGIPKAKLSTLFNQYAQADESISRRYGGSGLGLSISKKIIDRQGGTISVSSEVGEGSVFTFAIPYETAGAWPEAPEEKTKPVRAAFMGLRVLLAEDVEINRALQREMLSDLGAEVRACADGQEALDALASFRPDIVLLDIQMPGKNGLQAVGDIRRGPYGGLPVIAMTANIRASDTRRYIEAGFDGVIIKPFTEKELIDLLRKHAAAGTATGEEPADAGLPVDPAYDLHDLVKASKGNAEFVARMLRIFLMSSESILAKSAASLQSGNWEELSGQVHRLIPSCRQLSVDFMSERLTRIEALCHDGPDEAHIGKLMDEVRQAFDKLKQKLETDIARYEKAGVPVR